ncbi:energy transducer TonB family protein [Niveispirillum fermenti]|uniref:energy transducer TonB family protein n=1 Tax=Niveispirillum fermenti TaxID=1233113 RepID=UPI003A83E87A
MSLPARSPAVPLSGGGVRWGLAFALALGAHLGVAGVVALKPQAPPSPPPPGLSAIMMDLAPPAPPPPPPAPSQPAVTPPPAPKPPPVIERAEARLPPPPPRKPPRREPVPEIASRPVMAPSPAPAAESSADSAPSPQPVHAGPPPADALAAFQGRLLAHLARHKRYPISARQRRQQGTAWVRLTLDREGRVLAHRLERGSGITLLDREAEELLARAQPLPPLPPELGRDRMELVLPVEFSLR